MAQLGLGWRARLYKFGTQAEKVLEVLPHLTGDAPPIQRLLGLLSGASKVMGVNDMDAPSNLLSKEGFEQWVLEYEVRTFIQDLLHESALHRDTIQVQSTQMCLFYLDDESKSPVLATTRSVHQSGLYSLRGYDPMSLIGSLVWERGASLMLTAKVQNWHVRYSLKPMGEPGVYVGDPGPSHFVERLQKAHTKATRSLLLVGPSGSGKSTLARLISQGLTGTERTLKVSSDALKLCEPDALIDLLAALRPNVLLLDDISVDEGLALQKLLALYEALYGKTRLIVTTYMDDVDRDSDTGDGSLYWAGMRPGRIDEVYRIERPGPEQRRQILAHYLQGVSAPLDEIVAETDKLTGAYLAEVAYRVRTFGSENWQAEVAAVRRTAPITQSGAVRPAKG